MAALLGIDLGTSAIKAVVISEDGQLLGVGTREIPMEIPEPGRAEQDPEAWWGATKLAVRAALHQAATNDIAAIGIDGHMHGVLLLDGDRQPLGRYITWADQRGAPLIAEMEAVDGLELFLDTAGTRPAAGFAATTLTWLARHEPARLDAAATWILPKDYVRLRLTGELATDVTDASGTALFDVRARAWSIDLMARLGLPERILPPLLESADIAGSLTPDAATELGLRPGVPVAAGSSDQPALAVANGVTQPGNGSMALGTGGQVICTVERPDMDASGRVHTFCHAPPDRFYLLGATLAAGLSLRWLRDLLALRSADPYASLDKMASSVEPGSNGLTFMPYLVGERSPLMDPTATGAFVGLTLAHGRGHLARAVLEGVACSLRATRDAVIDAGGRADSWRGTGNGLASPLWRSIVADILGEPLDYVNSPERTGTGAALIAGIAAGRYANYAEASAAARPPLVRAEPDPERSEISDEIYGRYKRRSEILLGE